MNAAWIDVKNNIGYLFLMIQARIAPSMILFFTTLSQSVSAFVKGVAQAQAALIVLATVVDSATKGQFLSAEKLKEVWKNTYDEVLKNFDPEKIGKQIEDVFGKNKKSIKIPVEIDILTEDKENAIADFTKDIADMKNDIDRKLEQDKIDLARKMTDIDLNYQDEQIQNEIDYQREVIDINRDASESIADANLKYRENELKAEEDYQRQLQKLKDQFLFDLEDVLRTRDARQYTRLIRQYQLDKKNLARDNTAQAKDRQRQFSEELSDIERQRQRKLADASRDAEIKRQKTTEDWIRDREDAQRRFEQDQIDEQLRNKYKLQDLVNALADQGLKTKEGAAIVLGILTTYFGPGGYTDFIYKYLIAQINSAAYAMAMLSGMAKWGHDLNTALNVKQTGAGGNRYASGGAMIASRPTTAVFGEGGEPELAVFLPLSKIRNPVGNAYTRNGGNAGGKINLEVLLSPDLEARIVKQAADNVATTITRIQREK
jgi:hypothetical protein